MPVHPPGYPGVISWLVTGALRDWRGLTAALIAAWFNLPIAIFTGGTGLVLGGIAGYVGGTVGGGYLGVEYVGDVPVLDAMLDSFLLHSGGIVGMLAGALLGAVGGFLGGILLPWALIFSEDPASGIGLILAQLLTALLCGVLYTGYRVAGETWLLKLAGARRPSRRERELIEPILRDCGARLGLAHLPKLLIDDSREPNAYAGARHIVVNRGLLDEFNYEPEPLAGMLCHELTHWRNADAVSSMFIRGVALPLYLSYIVVDAMMRTFRHPVIRFALWLVFWPLLVCVRHVVVPAQAVGSRLAEHTADQGAVYAGHRQGLRRVLARLGRTFDGARNGWDLSVCASHPPNELRLERIEEPGVSYPLPDVEEAAWCSGVDTARAMPR